MVKIWYTFSGGPPSVRQAGIVIEGADLHSGLLQALDDPQLFQLRLAESADAGGTLHARKQALFVVIAQGGDRQAEHLRHLSDGIHDHTSSKHNSNIRSHYNRNRFPPQAGGQAKKHRKSVMTQTCGVSWQQLIILIRFQMVSFGFTRK